jgi:hypothetical protein
MAVEVDRLLKKDANHNQAISIAKNHIRCFCHKLALILNAGLKAISVPRRDQIPTGPVLGFVPGLCAISEESSDSGQVDPLANPFDTDGFVDDSDSDCSDDEGPELREANVIEKVLKKVSYDLLFIIFFISRSSP